MEAAAPHPEFNNYNGSLGEPGRSLGLCLDSELLHRL